MPALSACKAESVGVLQAFFIQSACVIIILINVYGHASAGDTYSTRGGTQFSNNVGCNPSSFWVNKRHINGLVGTTALSNQHDLTLHNDSQHNVFQ